MTLQRLSITDFRNITRAQLQPLNKGFNIIYGLNGSGKTSLLEAIYYLSRARSFRSAVSCRIIRHSTEKFSLFGQLGDQLLPIGVERHAQGKLTIRIAGRDVETNAELAMLTPVQLINSSSFILLEAPEHRRKYLDWGAFYLYPDFMRAWKHYERALKQRNAALRARVSASELESWSQELIDAAKVLNQFREDYVKQLHPKLMSQVTQLLPDIGEVEVSYYSGWNQAESYKTMLAKSIDKDRHMGFTQCGPHRADFKVNINKQLAKDILSRGQQKLLICGMLVSQGTLLQNGISRPLIYLIDDLPSELDLISRGNVIKLLLAQDAQLFVTAVEHESLSELLINTPTKMFHVEHGCVEERTLE